MAKLADTLRDQAIAVAKSRSNDTVESGHLLVALMENQRVIVGVDPAALPSADAVLPERGNATVPPFVSEEVEALLQRCGDRSSAQDLMAELAGIAKGDMSAPDGSDEKSLPQTGTAGPPALSFDEAMAELNALTGLAEVKRAITEIVALQRFNQERLDTSRKAVPAGLHMVFTGSPGTGKTTVARIVAHIYQSLGVLRTGQLVEVGRSDLVAGYVGQTAPKVERAVNRARGGVLFIDEAYALDGGYGRDFGNEAVATLVKKMEDHRDDLVVIVAGYTDAMQQFIEMNEGLKSRFQHFIHFPDYADSELVEIFRGMASSYDLEVDPSVADALTAQFASAPTDLRSGNARFARNVFEQMYRRMASRVLADNVISDDEHRGFSLDDLPGNSDKTSVPTKRAPGFR